MNLSTTTPKAISALKELVLWGLRSKSPKSGADICRQRALECREHAFQGDDLNQCAALAALADKWDSLATEMDRDGVSSADLYRSH
jgi:hypothetical protein